MSRQTQGISRRASLSSRKKFWTVLYYVLFIAFLGAGALNMLHVRGGFFTNYAADLVGPAWLYVLFRGLHAPHGRRSLIQRVLGRTPERAALSLFVASCMTEVTQLYWPHGVFSGRFDPLDLMAYALGLAICYAADKGLSDEQSVAPS